jgi:hypothetical protein
MDNNRPLLNNKEEAEGDIIVRDISRKFIECLVGKKKAAIVLLVNLIHHVLTYRWISLFLGPRFNTQWFLILTPGSPMSTESCTFILTSPLVTYNHASCGKRVE